MDFTELKHLIPKTAGKFQLQGELKASLVINRASTMIKEFFPEEVSCYIRVKKFKEGILLISVSNASVAQSVHMRSFQMKKDLNESLGEDLVKDIRNIQETVKVEEYDFSVEETPSDEDYDYT
jgi:hypothetical protein